MSRPFQPSLRPLVVLLVLGMFSVGGRSSTAKADPQLVISPTPNPSDSSGMVPLPGPPALPPGGEQPVGALASGVQCDPSLSLKLCAFEEEDGHTVWRGVRVSPRDPFQVMPAVAAPGRGLKRLDDIARQSGALAAINGGYFDRSRELSMSWVVADGQTLSDPSLHPVLNNPSFRLATDILNRAEWRTLSCAAGRYLQYDITAHNDPPPDGCTVLHALGGGPQLLPYFTLSQEAFYIRDPQTGKVVRDAIGAYQANARTGVGLLPDGSLLLVTASKKIYPSSMDIRPPKGPGNAPVMVPHRFGFTLGGGVGLPQMADWFTAKGCTKAMNLDGGSSTSLWIGDAPGQKLWLGKPLGDGRVDATVRMHSILGVYERPRLPLIQP